MASQNDLTTTVPKVTLADISDPTLHRLNLILERLFGLVAITDQKASDLGRKVYRATAVPLSSGYTPPTPGGEAPVWSPLDAPEPPTGITAALVTNPGGDRFGFRTTWSAPSPPGGTVKYDVWCKYYAYDTDLSTWTVEESDFVPLGGTDELFLESGYWALPDHTQRVRIWVRALNGVDEATARIEASYASPGYIEINPSAIATTAPMPPTSVAVEPLDKDGNYGLKTTWTPPSPLGTATDYQVEAGFWTDSGLTNNDVDADDDKNWIPLGGTSDNQLISGFWPRPTDASRWAKTRVRSVNSFGGAVSAWAESATAVQITAYTDSYIPPAAPNPPTSITLTITDSQGNFGFRSGWTAPSPLGGTVGYNVEARYWLDAALTTPESEWIPLGGTHNNSLDSGFWPRPAADRWVKIRVCGKNEIDELSSWVELTNAVKLEPLAAPGEPTSVSAIRLAKDDNYGIATAWNAPSPIGTATDYEVQARFWLDTGLTNPDSDWIPLGGTHDTTLISGFWPRPTDVPRYGRVRVRSLNALKGYSPWVTSSGYFTVEVAPSMAPAPNVSGVTASVLQSGNQWGFTATITWPSNRSEIKYALIYIVGPIGTSYEARKPWNRISVPVSGNTTISQEIEWERPGIGEPNALFRVEVETYNSGNVPTASPVSSANFTVTAMSDSISVTGLTASRNPTTTNLDGVEIYGIVGSFTIPNNSEIDHAEVYIRNVSDTNDKERGPAASTTPGVINTTVNYATDLWTLPGSSAFTIRITVYLVNAAGQRIGAGVTADTVITPGDGNLNLGRVDADTLGTGISLRNGKLVSTVRSLTNGDFEDVNADGSPADWDLLGSTNYTVETSGGVSGSRWLKFTCDGTFKFVVQDIIAIPGQVKRVGVRVKNASNSPAVLLAAYYINSTKDAAVGSIFSQSFGVAASTWQYGEIITDPAGQGAGDPSAVAFLRVEVIVYDSATTGYVGVDAFIVEDSDRVGNGSTRDAEGRIVPDLGPGMQLSVQNKIVPKLGPGLEVDGDSQRLFKQGTVEFTGAASFKRAGYDCQVIIDNTGITAKTDNSNYFSTTASGVTIKGGGKTSVFSATNMTLTQDSDNLVDVSYAGLTLKGGGKTATFNSVGITLTRDANTSLDMTSTGLTLKGGGKTVTVSATNITLTQDANNKVDISTSAVTITGGGSVLTMNSTGMNVTKGGNSVSITTSGITLTGTTTITTPDITVTGSGFQAKINTTDGIKATNTTNGDYCLMRDGFFVAYNNGAVQRALLSNESLQLYDGGTLASGSYTAKSISIGDLYGKSLSLASGSSGTYIITYDPGARITFFDANAYCYFPNYRFPISNIGTQSVPGTFSNWIAAYNSSGTFIGKIPLF